MQQTQPLRLTFDDPLMQNGREKKRGEGANTKMWISSE